MVWIFEGEKLKGKWHKERRTQNRIFFSLTTWAITGTIVLKIKRKKISATEEYKINCLFSQLKFLYAVSRLW